MKKRIENIKHVDSAKKFYKNYTKDFNYKNVERLFKEDAPGAFDFYVKRMKKPAKGSSTFTGKLLFIRNLFLEFLMQLTPARRIVYTAGFAIFVLGYLNSNWQWAVFSFILINLLIAFELADKLIAKDELAVARDIQSGLMPKNAPQHNHFDICGYSESAKEVGGDYFDFIYDEKSPEKIYLIIGDISGKGMAAALHMVQVRTILHNLVTHFNSPKIILIELNNHMKKVFRPGSFFTASMAELNSEKEIKLCRAGHLPLIHYSKNQSKCLSVIPAGMGIGLGNRHLFESTLEEKIIEPETGDILIFFTDGIIEARNEFLQEYGEERLKNIIQQNSHKSASLIKDSILESLQTFTKSAPKHDDITLLVMKTL